MTRVIMDYADEETLNLISSAYNNMKCYKYIIPQGFENINELNNITQRLKNVENQIGNLKQWYQNAKSAYKNTCNKYVDKVNNIKLD